MFIERLNCQGMARRFSALTSAALLLIMFSQHSFAQGENRGPRYPRLASIQVGDGVGLADPQRLNRMGKMDVALLGMWAGWGPFNGMTMSDVVDKLRSSNPDILVGPYTNVTELNESKIDLPDKVSKETGPNGKHDWWLRTADGSRTSHWSGNYSVNLSKFVTPDSNGQTYPEWLADYNYNRILSKARFNAVFSDVMTGDAIDTADWNGDGKNDGKTSSIAVEAVSGGHITYVNKLRDLQPGIIRIGNLTEVFHPKREMPSTYNQLVEGGLLEGFIGQSWAIEKWHGWHEMMKQYRRLMAALKEPRIGILNAHVGESDFRTLRYGLTSTLMDDGYFAADPKGRGDYTWQFWYDEFDLDLGYPVDPPQASAWSKGIYRREFDNGLVLVNPRGNGRQSVNVGSGWKRFSGTQDPAHNSGEIAQTISLADADGIILLRVGGGGGSPAAPMPPTLQ